MTKNTQRKRSPGNKKIIHKIKKKSKSSYCRICGVGLKVISKPTKSGRTVDRPYGGEVCHNCLRIAIQSSTVE